MDKENIYLPNRCESKVLNKDALIDKSKSIGNVNVNRPRCTFNRLLSEAKNEIMYEQDEKVKTFIALTHCFTDSC